MADFPLIVLLPIVTFAIVIAFALWSRARTKNETHRTTAEKSSLAIDGPGPSPFGQPSKVHH